MWCASSVQAQQMEEILQSVAQNNVELQARQQELEAAGLEIRMQNSLEDPSVEYSPFFRKGESGMTSSELVVKQGFDFPTVYAARGKAGKLQRSALERQWDAARQEVLLQACWRSARRMPTSCWYCLRSACRKATRISWK